MRSFSIKCLTAVDPLWWFEDTGSVWMEQRSADFVCKRPEVNVFIFEGHTIHVATVSPLSFRLV